MDNNKSQVSRQDLSWYLQLLATLLADVQRRHSTVFTKRALRLTLKKVEKRVMREGIGFLTKTLPSLGKSLDKALASEDPFNHPGLEKGSGNLPKLFGELFECVFAPSGSVLPAPCVQCIKSLRQILYLFYKVELPFEPEQEVNVVSDFVKTENDIAYYDRLWSAVASLLDSNPGGFEHIMPRSRSEVIRTARRLLFELFRGFDPAEIRPRHGPGVVSTKEQLWEKFRFNRINPRIQTVYPFDAYFCASSGHVCDSYKEMLNLPVVESLARVCLVPKDSRGPRLISCEPLEFMWVQQGLGRAIVDWTESQLLTKYNVHFTDQQPNRFGALLGSQNGRYATLDLKEASDRVTVGLVTLLFPEPLLTALLACRSLGTVLPDGTELKLRKFAPMGSALCFPVLALTIWSLLTASASDADARESILVYGDDVIVKTTEVANAIKTLEDFGLLVNRSKSCYQGFFRESCGMDAYQGVPVTPVRIRTPWHHPTASEVYTSWIETSNQMWKQGYTEVAEFIGDAVQGRFGRVPSVDMHLACPSLYVSPHNETSFRRRVNKSLQRLEWLVPCEVSPSIKRERPGWEMLLRFFSESPLTEDARNGNVSLQTMQMLGLNTVDETESFSVRLYTRRHTMKIAYRWRAV